MSHAAITTSPTIERAALVHRLIEWQLFFLTGEEYHGTMQDDGEELQDYEDLCAMARGTGDAMLAELAAVVEQFASSWARAFDAIQDAKEAARG